MEKTSAGQGQFSMLIIGFVASAALVVVAALAASHGHLPNYPSDVPLPGTLLGPTTLSRIVEVCAHGLRYRHWAIGAVTTWHGALASRGGV